MTAPSEYIHTKNELVSHVPFPNLVRLNNFWFSSNNSLESRQGFEPVHYMINPEVEPGVEPCHIEFEETQGLLRMPELIYKKGKTYFLNHIETETLTLFGDSLIVSGPNASSFHIIPLALNINGISAVSSYIAKDNKGNLAEGDERGGMHVYQGKVVFWNGKGSYQVFANSVNESGFTKLNNSVLPLEDQTIIAACTFENRLVVGTLQGNILWSPPNWDGVSLWDDVGAQGENYLKVTLGPGEIIEFMRDFRGGLVISTRTSAKVSGRILNIPTLDAQGLSINVAGTNSFFTRNGVVSLDDTMVGIAPQGILRVGFDSYSKTAIAKNEASPISELLVEIFANNTIYSYLDAFQDTKAKRAYYLYEWDIEGRRTTKILNYQYDVQKWSVLETALPIQRMFMYYGFAAGAGYVKDDAGNIYLGIWSLSDLRQDLPIVPKGQKIINNKTYFFWDYGDSKPSRKYWVTGHSNMADMGQFVPGTGNLPVQVFFSTDEEIEFKTGHRKFTKYGSWSLGTPEYDLKSVALITTSEKWSDTVSNAYGKWGSTFKTHYTHQKINVLFPNADLVYQVFFESYSDAHIVIHDIGIDKGSNS